MPVCRTRAPLTVAGSRSRAAQVPTARVHVDATSGTNLLQFGSVKIGFGQDRLRHFLVQVRRAPDPPHAPPPGGRDARPGPAAQPPQPRAAASSREPTRPPGGASAEAERSVRVDMGHAERWLAFHAQISLFVSTFRFSQEAWTGGAFACTTASSGR